MQKIFDAGNMNEGGICRRWACDWISRSLQGQVIRSRYDLSSAHGNRTNGPRGNAAVVNSFGLNARRSATNTNPPLSVAWMATELTRGTGYFLFSVRGRTLNVATGRFDNSGHAMATRKGIGPLQFFDPNEGLMEFDNSKEFYDYLPSFVLNTYPDLLSREAEVLLF
jgi:hypothetical protein